MGVSSSVVGNQSRHVEVSRRLLLAPRAGVELSRAVSRVCPDPELMRRAQPSAPAQCTSPLHRPVPAAAAAAAGISWFQT